MKRTFLSLLILFLFSLGISARTFVLVVGVSNYGDESVNLSQTTKDAKAFRDVMATQTKDITLLTSKYANKANILEKLKAICNRAQQADRIVFYFSGHGMPGGICTYDDVLFYSELADQLSTSSAREKICYIDACHAGSVNNANKGKGESLSHVAKTQKNQIYLVACRADEYSYENAWVGAGFFTQGLIKGLRGKSDSNGDKKVTLIELFKYIYNDVVKRSKSEQHPQLIGSANLHDVIVAKW